MNTDYIFDSPREFLVLNASDEPAVMAYDGETPTIPAKDKVTYPDPKAPHREFSGKDSEGNWIPGSLLLRDKMGERACADIEPGQLNPRGSYWSASECIKHALGINPVSRQAEGLLSKRGVGILPLNPSPETVQKLREQLADSNVDFMLQWAKDTLQAYMMKHNTWQAKGMQPLPPGKDYYKAKQIVDAYNKKMASAAGVDADGYLNDAESTSDEIMALAKELAEDAAEKMLDGTPDADLQALVSKLMGNKKFQNLVKETHDIRKRAKPRSESPFGGA